MKEYSQKPALEANYRYSRKVGLKQFQSKESDKTDKFLREQICKWQDQQ